MPRGVIQQKFCATRLLDIGANTLFEYELSLEDVLSSAQIASIKRFAFYKFNAVSFRLVPKQNVVGTATITQFTYRNLYTLFEPNPERLYGVPEAIPNNPRHRKHSGIVGFNRYCKLKPTMRVAMGDDTAVDYRAKSRFISTNDTGADYGRFIVGTATDSANAVSMEYDLFITAYVSLRNVQVVDYDIPPTGADIARAADGMTIGGKIANMIL